MWIGSRILLGSAIVATAVSCAATDDVVGVSAPSVGGAGPTGGSGGGALPVGGAGSGGALNIDAGGDGSLLGDPCDPDNPNPSYVGCDFWPTVTTNSVWEVFDFAVVVANAGVETASIKIEKDGQPLTTGEVPPGELRKFYLPWVPELKWEAGTSCGALASISQSVRAVGAAYHLTSSSAVTAYQFNPLEYRGQGGPEGKVWDSCPGLQPCFTNNNQPIGCYSFTNDASLLLPSNAWTSTYRVMGQKNYKSGSFIAITAAEDGTTVQVKLAKNADVQPGTGVAATALGSQAELTLDAGDVVQLIGDVGRDFAGSLVLANKKIQVISGARCTQEPQGTPACDHLEETVLPAEALGTRYFVTAPTAVHGNVVGHHVRIFGNVDGTKLSYPSGTPAGAPTLISAGEVVDLEHVEQDFEVVGSSAFGVGTYMLGGMIQDPPTSAGDEDYQGDPSQSFTVPVEQYRKKYVFLAPDDYDVSYVDVVAPESASIQIDGNPVTANKHSIGSAYAVLRVKLGPGNGGAHVLVADQPVGIQVMGYGTFTSYQYPGGADIQRISLPPVK
ncbi:MAG: IgGFc-binding protein [Myxococcales bacterium]|nr:IgGFc-binding protein [Myxococcales bacterium]